VAIFHGNLGGSVKYQLSRVLIGPGLRTLARTKVIGAENVPESGAGILASNHLSVLDSFYLPYMLERPVTFAAKSEYFTGTRLQDRIVGAYLRATKQLSVDRTGTRAAQEMLEAALGLLNDGALFGIYPEGTRSPDGRLYRGRTGVGWLALHSGAPVIPVAMVGTDRLLPPGHKIPRPGRIQIRIGKPLTFGEFAGGPAGAKQRREVTDRVMAAIGELSGKQVEPIYASARKEQLAAAKEAAAKEAAAKEAAA
jgi:1-acyl-sn-glycerol-3-phosphate acyltransferase